MPAIQTLLEDNIINFEHLDIMLTALHDAGKITRNQYKSAKQSLRQFVPGFIIVKQRTPRSVIEFETGAWRVKVNNRAHVNITQA